MHWEKKICIRLTTRRIVGAILVASTVANVVIVGAMFDAASSSPAPTITSALTSPLANSTLFMPTGISIENFTSTHTSGSTPVSTGMPSQTFTPTQASLDIPTLWIVCIKRFYWRIYRVQQGETLYSLAPAIGTTVNELMAGNCLPNDQIYAGQQLYVPRLPGTVITVTFSSTPTDTPSFTPTSTHTATPTDTPSLTPTNTPSFTPTDTPTATPTNTPSLTPTDTATDTPTNVPTIFQDPVASYSLCSSTSGNLFFRVTPYDPQGISAVTAFYNINNGTWYEIAMGPDGATYYGLGSETGKYSTNDTFYYRFRAIDMLGEITTSITYSTSPLVCP